MPSIEAEILFVVPDGTTPVAASVGPQGQVHNEANLQARRVTLLDLREVAPPPSLDREGFEIVEAPTEVDLFDHEAVENRHYAEARALIAARTGARRVEVFDHTLRTSSPEDQAARGHREPVRTAHNDYTEASGPNRLRLALPQEADQLLRRRFAIIQLWRPVGHPAERDPLVLCDGRSVRREDLIRAERRHQHRTGEIYFVAHHPEQRWCFTPDLRPEEAYLFVVYDSDPARPQLTPHTSIDWARPGAPPRQSIEVRALAFF